MPEQQNKTLMSNAAVIITILQWLGCLPTLFFSYISFLVVGSLTATYGGYTFNYFSLIFFACCLLSFLGWLVFKVWHLVLFMKRDDRFLKIYHIGVLYAVFFASLTLAVINSDLYDDARGGVMFVLIITCIIIPVTISILLSKFYVSSQKVQQYMGTTSYIEKSPIIKRMHRARKLAEKREQENE